MHLVSELKALPYTKFHSKHACVLVVNSVTSFRPATYFQVDLTGRSDQVYLPTYQVYLIVNGWPYMNRFKFFSPS
jgi:hypothetical protein